ncbi:hypothetical protein GCM10027277_07420 [Pseudoduganella ginsengisoli]|uniref:CHASE2 domain-containing protein n=1 Tax=Pseudoduganella ginsengisoli TaxID=1462440 RepID=A0A6L6Q8Z3_9BURK|nr:CHASE2 domain-containing protein [Pseudoduganella ginsengisoli]MTW05939.1 CHASE2 domain-containing protein [Pseudoduganella ginsengisoli]
MHIHRLILTACLLFAGNLTAWAGSFEQDFAVVYIDKDTEAKYGALPINRSVLAKGMDAIAAAGAKGLVIKFFVDQPKDEQDDKRLANSLSRIPVVLQARLDDSERTPNPLAVKFTLGSDLYGTPAATSGWIPLPRFADHVQDIGFVDFHSNVVPMVERYQSHAVKSLVLCAIELAAGKKAQISDKKQIQVGSRIIPVDDQNRVTVQLITPQFNKGIAFNAVLDGTAKLALQNKIVVLAYDGPHIPTVSTPLGPLGAHKYFVNILRSLYDAAPDRR